MMFKCKLCGKIIYAPKNTYMAVLREHLKEHPHATDYVLKYFYYGKYNAMRRDKRDKIVDDTVWVKACEVFPCPE